jgi:nucleoside-diphosphate-sugar epimerase
MSHKVLVTGSQGYLGRYVIHQLLEQRLQVVGVGRSPPMNFFTHTATSPKSGRRIRAPLPSMLRPTSRGYEYRAVDLSNPAAVETVIAEVEPKVVIHLAAALRDDSWRSLHSANVLSVTILIEALGRLKHPPFLLFGSSGSVYGNQAAMPLGEDTMPDPVGLYSASKYMGEIAARATATHLNIPLVIARLFNLVGPGLQDRHLAARLAQEIAMAEAGLLAPHIQTGPLTATRDFIDVRDAARMLVELVQLSSNSGALNIATGIEIPVRDLANSLVERAATSILLSDTNDNLARPGADRQVADVRRATALGLKAQIALDQSLDDMLAYSRAVE